MMYQGHMIFANHEYSQQNIEKESDKHKLKNILQNYPNVDP